VEYESAALTRRNEPRIALTSNQDDIVQITAWPAAYPITVWLHLRKVLATAWLAAIAPKSF
jgi:hypothetical protein